jgi:acetylornithine deacetylase/succinyl-diaminopimelate desuccinylase-like protein
MPDLERRRLLQGAAALAAAALVPRRARAVPEIAAVHAEVEKRHDEAVRRLQEWVRQPSVSAENLGIAAACDLTMRLLRDAGFGRVDKVETDGHPGIFATLDAGAPRTLGLYFMYDVKGVNPKEWKSPPFEAALVDEPGLGKVLLGRGAVNQKGPESALLAALHAIRGAGRKLPMNLVLVAEGEEELGSPHFVQVVHRADVVAALRRAEGIVMPTAAQDRDGNVYMVLGGKGIVQFELVVDGAAWPRGASKDLHSGQRARVESAAFHLVQALASLVTPDGVSPAIDGLLDNARPLSDAEKALLDAAAKRSDEETAKRVLGVKRWANGADFRTGLEWLASRPTINIQGILSGYTGPGGKTILPHRALAKLEVRLVPDMKAADVLPAIRAHLQKRGFDGVEVRPLDGAGYGPTTTPVDAAIVQRALAVYRKAGNDPIVWPRSGGSWPGYLFTGEPLRLPALHFGLGYGEGAHAPNELYVIESSNPKIQGYDGAVKSFVDFLYAFASA